MSGLRAVGKATQLENTSTESTISKRMHEPPLNLTNGHCLTTVDDDINDLYHQPYQRGFRSVAGFGLRPQAQRGLG